VSTRSKKDVSSMLSWDCLNLVNFASLIKAERPDKKGRP